MDVVSVATMVAQRDHSKVAAMADVLVASMDDKRVVHSVVMKDD